MPLLCCALHAVMCILQHNLGADICRLKQQGVFQHWSDCMCCSAHLLPRHSDTAVLPFGILYVSLDMLDGPGARHSCLSMCLPGLQDTNKVLAISRIMVAWQPLGLAMGTYDMCNRYLQQRQQFGSPLAAFQVELCTDVKEE